jgi:ubiquinone/menaquinone biosynthesis C-methylase UbiE
MKKFWFCYNTQTVSECQHFWPLDQTLLKTSRAFFEHLAEEWDNRQPPDRPIKLDQLLSRFDAYIQTADLLLEVGTGTGGLLPLLKKRYPKPKIIQIDFANAMLIRAQNKHNDDHLVQADVHELPFPREKYSVVLCHNSFPHFKEKLIALKEMRRVLQPGGVLLIMHEMLTQVTSTLWRKKSTRTFFPVGRKLKHYFSSQVFAQRSLKNMKNIMQSAPGLLMEIKICPIKNQSRKSSG